MFSAYWRLSCVPNDIQLLLRLIFPSKASELTLIPSLYFHELKKIGNSTRVQRRAVTPRICWIKLILQWQNVLLRRCKLLPSSLGLRTNLCTKFTMEQLANSDGTVDFFYKGLFWRNCSKRNKYTQKHKIIFIDSCSLLNTQYKSEFMYQHNIWYRHRIFRISIPNLCENLWIEHRKSIVCHSRWTNNLSRVVSNFIFCVNYNFTTPVVSAHVILFIPPNSLSYIMFSHDMLTLI